MSQMLTDLADLYIQLKPHLSTGTKDIYRLALRHLRSCLGGDKDVDAVTPIHAQQYVLYLTQRGLAPASVNMYLRSVRAFFRWLVDSEILQRDPFRRVRQIRDKAVGHTPYEDAEITAVLEQCRDDRWRLIMLLALTAGLRRGEILNLTVAEIDYHAMTITIRAKAGTDRTWAWEIKDHESRTVPLTSLTETLLLRQQASLPEEQPYVCLTPRRYQHLLSKMREGRLTYRDRKCPEGNFRRTFCTIIERAGVAYRPFKSTRTSALSIMAEAGLQPTDLQAIAGHADVRTTARHYLRPRQALMDRARNAAYKQT